ncbi:hypothetical protein B0H14DRAFT_3158888 [Mycena olivaceomarginata]|nr:hypothetical protein B0H14DRAFT_3158888 [Mycena olivaceomarginata]
MNPTLNLIDPALLNLPGGSSGRNSPDATNGVASSPPRSSRTTRKFSKADIDSWEASNYAPQRDRNETRLEYEDRLTHISRKSPLREACDKLQLKIPKSVSLERLRAELSKHWFTALPNRVPENYTRQPPTASKRFTKQRATDAHDVLASVLAPPAEPLHFPPPVGALPAVSSNGRGEFFPLFHIAIPNGASSSSSAVPHNASASGSSGRRPGPNTAQSNRSRPTAMSPPGLLPSAIPRTPEHDERLAARLDSSAISPLVEIPPLQELDDVEESKAALLRAYDVAGANAYEMLGYDDEDEGAGHPLGLAHFLADKATMASFHNLRALSITFAESDFNHIHASIAPHPGPPAAMHAGPRLRFRFLIDAHPARAAPAPLQGPVALLPLVLRGSHPKHLTLTQRGGSATELLKTLLRTRCDTKSVSSLAIRVALHADICADPALLELLAFFPRLTRLAIHVSSDRTGALESSEPHTASGRQIDLQDSLDAAVNPNLEKKRFSLL